MAQAIMATVAGKLASIMVHPIINARLCKRGDTTHLQIGRLRIQWRVVSMEWQDLCDEADAREREERFRGNR